MKKYHKIQSVFKHNPKTKYKTLLEGEFALPEFEYLKNNQWIFTEKVDGINIRVHWNHETMSNLVGSISFAGRTNNAQTPPFLLKKLEELFPPLKFRTAYPETTMTLYGEGYGAKIRKGGGCYRKDQSFVLFDVKIDDWWLRRKDVEEIAAILDIEVVPVLGYGTLQEMIELARQGFNSIWGDFKAEGIVARPDTELKTRGGHRIITKIKHKDFTEE